MGGWVDGCVGLSARPPRGDELGVVTACCQDDTECALLVDKMVITAKLSTHSALCSTTSMTRAVWRMHEASVCLAWKVDGSQVTVITP